MMASQEQNDRNLFLTQQNIVPGNRVNNNEDSLKYNLNTASHISNIPPKKPGFINKKRLILEPTSKAKRAFNDEEVTLPSVLNTPSKQDLCRYQSLQHKNQYFESRIKYRVTNGLTNIVAGCSIRNNTKLSPAYSEQKRKSRNKSSLKYEGLDTDLQQLMQRELKLRNLKQKRIQMKQYLQSLNRELYFVRQREKQDEKFYSMKSENLLQGKYLSPLKKQKQNSQNRKRCVTELVERNTQRQTVQETSLPTPKRLQAQNNIEIALPKRKIVNKEPAIIQEEQNQHSFNLKNEQKIEKVKSHRRKNLEVHQKQENEFL